MKTYTIPKYLERPTNRYDAVANMTHFLLANENNIHAKWVGHMTAKDQRRLFGQFLGKGRVIIDGENERLAHVRKCAFGTDFDVTYDEKW